jgi:exodeoxyribonuclease VII small subunit
VWRWSSPRAASAPGWRTRALTDEPTFEEAQRELEGIVHRLETGETPLDEALRLWQRGEELYRLCRERLDVAEGRIEELAGRVEATRPEKP